MGEEGEEREKREEREGGRGEGAERKVSRFEARALFLTLGSHLTNQEAS